MNVAVWRPAMTLPLAIRPRIQLRDEPERSRTAWLPPMALPIAAYWGVMGFLTYSISKAPSWLASEATQSERAAVDVGPVERLAHVVAARAETPPAPSKPLLVREETSAVPDETPAVRSTIDEVLPPPEVTATPPHRALLEPQPALSNVARAPHDTERARNAHRSRRNGGPGDDSFEAQRTSSVAIHFDPVRRDSFAMRDVPGLTPFVPTPSEAPPAAARPVAHARSSLPSCESAASAAKYEWDLTAARGAPDLSRDAYAAVLENGAYLLRCAVPDGTALDICAAVQKGRPLGITVAAHPANPEVSACVKAAVESLSFPSHPRLDVTRTHFEAVNRR